MIKIGQNIILEISKDGLSAYITLMEDQEENHMEQDLMESLKEVKAYILYGLNEKLLTSILEEKIINAKMLIGEGKAPINGKDGSIKYNFDMEKPLLPKINKDGTVDYRELDSITKAKKGDILAEIIPPKEGCLGIKVTGEEIPYKKGRTPKLRPGKNTSLSFDGNQLLADTTGLVECKNGKVTVSELLKVENVDSSIGNIKFDGNIIISKDVFNGYCIDNTGSVEVKGSVEGGFINSSGDVLIRQGIQGYNKMAMCTKGNLCTKFIENAIVKVKGNITSEAIMHSDVSSNSNIIVLGRKGLIVGGTCRATYEIRARVIGSTMATTTTLQVGVNPELKCKYDELELNLTTCKSNLKKIEQSLNVLETLKKCNKLDKNKKELYDNLIRAQLSLNIEIRNITKEIKGLKMKISQLNKGRIKVADTIYPGVKIIIGNDFMFIKDEIKNCTFYRKDGEIRVGPY